ncbi:homeobox protein SBH1-like [Camellia sinensis]|uniref:homeobox protein SBH1-like n=1 Tax=Camellia sinensis TaxID=4442 RepID=UPI0010362955|nr:homeobox protein SBH1-like [Camellia sinensis]
MAIDPPALNLAISSSIYLFKAIVGLIRSPVGTFKEEDSISNEQQEIEGSGQLLQPKALEEEETAALSYVGGFGSEEELPKSMFAKFWIKELWTIEGGGGSSGTSCLMGFGENNYGLCPMMMMMPPSHPNVDNNNTLFLPIPLNNNNHIYGQNTCNNNNTNSGRYFIENHNNNNDDGFLFVRAKIMAHPHYHRPLAAYVNRQKIGAPPEVVARLESAAAVGRAGTGTGCIGEDPALDQFMEAYCEMLTKYEQELSKPFNEAMLFLSRIECQFKALTLASSDYGCHTSLPPSLPLLPLHLSLLKLVPKVLS